MRLVIDLQGAQTESRFRGIGRYSLSLAREMTRQRGRHDVVIVLNGMFSETIEPLRAAFSDLLPAEKIVVWDAVGPTREVSRENRQRREIAERMREAFLAQLQPDVVLVTSLFEGLGDDAVTSIGKLGIQVPTAAILYDLIPLISPDEHFRNSSIHQDWYAGKIRSLRNASWLLAISESARQEAIRALGWNEDMVFNISGACEDWFRRIALRPATKQAVLHRAGIRGPFVMYTGGADERKNLPRLIEAFAALPVSVRADHQLVLAGKMPASHVDLLRRIARQHGLVRDEVVFTGFVPDEDLVALYNCCKLFVFPSTHEGLGMPPLEAMRCGAPVIASNASSLPEVMGATEAQFDPGSVTAIGTKMQQALTDEAFRRRLLANGEAQVGKFSWAASAARAWRAFEEHVRERRLPTPDVRIEDTSVYRSKRKRILVIKLDHLGDFTLAMPAVAKLRARYPGAEIDAVVGSWNRELAAQTGLFRRIYTLDFFKKTSATTPELSQRELEQLLSQLDAYDIALDLRRQADTRFLLSRVRADLKAGYTSFDPETDARIDVVLPAARDVQFKTIELNRISSSVQMTRLVDALPASDDDYIALPAFRAQGQQRRRCIGIFPLAGSPVKEWGILRFAELADLLAGDTDVEAVHVYFGSEQEASRFPVPTHAKVRVLHALPIDQLMASLATDAVCVANNSFGAHIASYCGCFVVGVYGGHETPAEWGPTVGEGFVLHTGEPCSPCHIVSRGDCRFGMACLEKIQVADVATVVRAAYHKHLGQDAAWQGLVVSGASTASVREALLRTVAPFSQHIPREELVAVARCIASNQRVSGPRQLLVDISELAVRDARTGIQRVVRSILQELLANPPAGFVVEPVYAADGGYRYAHAFMRRMGASDAGAQDEFAEAGPGDIFLGIDLHPISAGELETLARWRTRGVKVGFVVYDLLPLTLPWAFEGLEEGHQDWLTKVSTFDSLIAISQDVANDVWSWLSMYGQPRERPLEVGHFHLGADLANSVPTTGISQDEARVLDLVSQRVTFIMVGTLEPRKGHKVMLDAMERLWSSGFKVNLLIVGKKGWMVDDVSERLRNHVHRDRFVFWCDGASDEFLEAAYRNSSALVAASEGEGFGLPLIEAAKHGLPVIARDLPVFREVAGDAAHYFARSATAADLAEALRSWLQLFRSGAHPRPEGIRWQSWKDATQQLVGVLTGRGKPRLWRSDGVLRWTGVDPRFHSRVGRREGRVLASTGAEGHLLFGHYLALAPGAYRFRLHGALAKAGPRAHADVACDSGRRLPVAPTPLGAPAKEWSLELAFVLAHATPDVEVRVWVDAETMLMVARVELAQDDAPALEVAQDEALVA